MTKLIKPFTGDYQITQSFGEKITDSNGHSGIDYGLPLGTPVLAAADGEVWKAGWDSTGYGNCVMIKHPDGSGTVYGHLLNWSVYAGQKVKAGEKIGNSGNSGNSTGAHLHFEYRTKSGYWQRMNYPSDERARLSATSFLMPLQESFGYSRQNRKPLRTIRPKHYSPAAPAL